MFKSSMEKAYNLELVIERLKRNILKKDETVNKQHLNELINTIALYHKDRFERVPNQLYKDENKDLVDLAKEDDKTLTEIFNMNNLYQLLRLHPNNTKTKYKDDDNFRRRVMHVVLYEIIEQNGKEKGAEYGLLFAKIFNFDLAVPMHYASYDGMFDHRFLKFYDTYLGLDGSPYTYWLPNYYDNDPKSKYNLEDLSELTPQLRNYINKYKINSKK